LREVRHRVVLATGCSHRNGSVAQGRTGDARSGAQGLGQMTEGPRTGTPGWHVESPPGQQTRK
jgi:hypothetical protein